MTSSNDTLNDAISLMKECQDTIALLDTPAQVTELEEGVIRKKVVRGRKLVKKLKCTNPNQELVGGTCKQKTSTRKITLRKAKRKEVRTKKADVAGKKRAIRKQKKSVIARHNFGLK